MDKNRILVKISETNEYIELFKEILPKSEQDYINSKKDQYAMERLL